MGFRPKLTYLSILTSLGLTTNLKLLLDAGDISSAPGLSGTDWLDVSGGGFNFTLGASASHTASDPEFSGSPAGGLSPSECFRFPFHSAGTCFVYDAGSNAAWMDNIHKDSAKFTFLVRWFPSSGMTSSVALTGTTVTAAGPGFLWAISNVAASKYKQRLFVGDGAGATVLDVNSIAQPVFDTWNWFGVSVDEAVGANGGFFYTNGVSDFFNSTYTSPSAATATTICGIGTGGYGGSVLLPPSDGSAVALVLAWEGVALTSAQLTAIVNADVQGSFTTRGSFPP